MQQALHGSAGQPVLCLQASPASDASCCTVLETLPGAQKPAFPFQQLPTITTFSAAPPKAPGSKQPLLPCYAAGIDKLQFQPNGDISGMVSAEGELVPLKARIKPSTVGGAVEKWLIQVLMLVFMWLSHDTSVRSAC